jgi:NTE family protein
LFAGASAGSIAAAALSCKIEVDDIADILMNTDFNKFKDDSYGYVRDAWRLINEFGWYKGNALENWFGQILEKYTGDSEIDLQGVHDKYGTTLIIVITDINQGTPIYVSYKTHPKMKVKVAVRRSSSIPIFFKADKEMMNTEVCGDDGKICYKDIDHYFIDGGVLDNYPIKQAYKHVPKEQVIGIKLMTTKEIHQLKNPHIPSNPYPPKNLFNYVILLITMLRSNLLKMHIDDEDWERTIKVDVEDVSATDFGITLEDKRFLLEQGVKAANNFFNQ